MNVGKTLVIWTKNTTLPQLIIAGTLQVPMAG